LLSLAEIEIDLRGAGGPGLARTTCQHQIPALLAACRPRQWTKNPLVLASHPLFSFRFEPSLWLAAGQALTSLALATAITPARVGVILLYTVIQVAYCLQRKRQPLIDRFCISSGFLLRAIAGVAAAALRFSPWFLLTVGLFAQFLAIEKRKAELRVSQDRGLRTRKVLERYSLPLWSAPSPCRYWQRFCGLEVPRRPWSSALLRNPRWPALAWSCRRPGR
jgi:hypothetical protein